ncbi:adiponectin receptor protein [Anaeramoeba flamelloides]|uniref:Adiponectin receptor protein n=1 Tax=Anaeramoeba flamelloides TaxID=1746091 RepID=A0AAV7ZLU2_9EUKA|nr:adiponectin receptor protein [Anaeramoeba flamelloides]KAJ6239999.1 adiponectin receptor protein [Anaeramoeba flamelloides]
MKSFSLHSRLTPRSQLSKKEKNVQHTNPYLLYGYRNKYSKNESIVSIFQLHNETINIWSHFFCFVLTILFNLRVYFSNEYFQYLTFSEKMVYALFMLGCLCGYGNSTLLHVFDCISVTTSKFLLKVDLTGIVLMIVTGFHSFIYFIYFEFPTIRNIYMLMPVVLISILMFLTWVPQGFLVKFRWLRTVLITLLFGSGIIPSFHLLFLIPSPIRWSIFFSLALMFAVMTLGGLCYAFFLPERWIKIPIIYIFGHSHQWWHFLVAVATYLHYRSILLSIQYYVTNNPKIFYPN